MLSSFVSASPRLLLAVAWPAVVPTEDDTGEAARGRGPMVVEGSLLLAVVGLLLLACSRLVLVCETDGSFVWWYEFEPLGNLKTSTGE